jgi:hypothetical protein
MKLATARLVNPVIPGTRYGMLTVIKEARYLRVKHGASCRQVLVRCDCGVEKVMRLGNLQRARTHSCGCDKGFHNRPDVHKKALAARLINGGGPRKGERLTVVAKRCNSCGEPTAFDKNDRPTCSAECGAYFDGYSDGVRHLDATGTGSETSRLFERTQQLEAQLRDQSEGGAERAAAFEREKQGRIDAERNIAKTVSELRGARGDASRYEAARNLAHRKLQIATDALKAARGEHNFYDLKKMIDVTLLQISALQ